MLPEFTETWVTGLNNTSFYTRTYPAVAQPAKAHVVFVHGFQEHISRYDHVFQRVQAADISVFAFDQRGWGRTALDEEHKSPSSSYGLTTRPQQLADLEFFVNRAKEEIGKEVPLFLWGQSMGGALVLSFTTAKHGPPAETTIRQLSGVISGSPLIRQTVPASRVLRLVGAVLAKIVPWAPFPAKIPAEDLTRDSAVVAAAKIDPFMKPWGTLSGLNDMLSAGEYLADRGFEDWPEDMPLLMVHGTEDKITSYTASHAFFEKIKAKDKEYISFEGAYHEIHNEPEPTWKKDVDDIVGWINKHLKESAKL
ncbi:hypothetical protein FRB99_004068 [Tulasnella sp. 403]|nr:hypothetical protein FRB99_004068 [Tulasnella sp. 403]